MNTPTRNFLVAFTATATGKDALNLGAALARTADAHLHIVTVLPEDNAYAGIYPSDRGHVPIIQKKLRRWLEEAQAALPSDVSSSIHIINDSSDGAGLLAAAEQLKCSAIIVGGRRGGILRRYRIGTTANTLLHSSPIPVVLAPTGYDSRGPIERITAMFGQRAGSEAVIRRSIHAAQSFDLPLRLVSLVFIDQEAERSTTDVVETNTQSIIEQVERFGNQQLAEQASELTSAGRASTTVATGKTVSDTVDQLSWTDRELVIIGSSRLASPSRIFLGSTASRMLRSIAAPMMIIPAEQK